MDRSLNKTSQDKEKSKENGIYLRQCTSRALCYKKTFVTQIDIYNKNPKKKPPSKHKQIFKGHTLKKTTLLILINVHVLKKCKE